MSKKDRRKGNYREPEIQADAHRPVGPPQAREYKSQKAQLKVMPPGPNKDVKRGMSYKTGLADWREKVRREEEKRKRGGLEQQVQAVLDGDRDLQGYGLKVKAAGGRVWLSGIVDTLADKERAAELVAAIPGVEAVENGISISTDGPIDDAEITMEVQEELSADPAVNLRRVGAEAKKGTVFLVGSTDDPAEAEAARQAAARARGVHRV
ncbi:MAG: BON domain-containing protein, partial [Moorella sp. (in: Bacteria)]|nr:BON domain-containing protein [Moorella sp. (in: firmicutes)]